MVGAVLQVSHGDSMHHKWDAVLQQAQRRAAWGDSLACTARTMREPSKSLSCTDVDGCDSSTPGQVVWKVTAGSDGVLLGAADSPAQHSHNTIRMS